MNKKCRYCRLLKEGTCLCGRWKPKELRPEGVDGQHPMETRRTESFISPVVLAAVNLQGSRDCDTIRKEAGVLNRAYRLTRLPAERERRHHKVCIRLSHSSLERTSASMVPSACCRMTWQPPTIVAAIRPLNRRIEATWFLP